MYSVLLGSGQPAPGSGADSQPKGSGFDSRFLQSAPLMTASCAPSQPVGVRRPLHGGQQTLMDCIYTALFQRPLKVLHNIASHSPIHEHIHTPTAESATQGDGQLVRSSQGEASRSGTPRHSARRSWGSNQRPPGYQPTRSTS